MAYLTFDILNESKFKFKKNCIPLDLSYIDKDYRLICINTHIFNVLTQATGSLIGMALGQFILKSSIKSILPLAAVLTTLQLTPLLEQYDARDFCLIKGDDPNYFDASDALIKCPVLACNDGKVIAIYNGISNVAAPGNSTNIAVGNFIVLEHYDGAFYSLYGHLYHNSIKVKKGDIVKKGETIGLVGNTGNSIAPHLHFELTRTSPSNVFTVGKNLENFEDYKYTDIPWKEFLTNGFYTIAEYYNKPLKMNKTGVVDSLCYLT